ncbi:hypothetical protein Gocc_1309 [Gaiella occulta]|uniref:Antitoxin n=1 Tax=Gaiella occulta TaxID=1002870 RepID=A0A7M2Z131_9ACTN|nr:CopG family transcriptional regulator [Gaiella occulta]RDI75511.1 hypothetical protein Gocc_1309 [Gaiella occulta]
MRTTVTIDPELQTRVKALARERGVSFREALNDVLRRGLGHGSQPAPRPYEVPARPLGLRPGIDLDKALALAAELEDGEIVRKLELRK